MKLVCVILAAGKGTRMKSETPKVLHQLAGRPLVNYSLVLAQQLSAEPPVLVVGYGAEPVTAAVGEAARFVLQKQQLGTGHAVLQAETLLSGQADLVLVYAADMPLLTTETLRKLTTMHNQHHGPLTMLTVMAADPRGFGRVLRDEHGAVLGVVEEVEATPAQRAIRELNVGVYCFDASWLWAALRRIKPSPQKGEYYLTDTIALAVADGYRVEALCTENQSEALGVNTRVHLAEAEGALRKRINTALMTSGVTMADPERTYIHPGVAVGRDSELGPGVSLLGATSLGSGCEIGPGAVLVDTQLGDHCRVGAHAVLEGVVAGPARSFPPGLILTHSNE